MYLPPETTRAADATEPGRPGAPVDPRRVLGVVRGGMRSIAIAAIVSALAGVLVAMFVVERTYAAESTLVWEPVGASDAAEQTRAIETIVASVELPTNLAEVRRRLGMTTTLTALATRLEVVHGDDSELITLRALGPTPEEAHDLVTTATDVLIAHREGVDRARLEEQLARVERALASAERARDESRRTYDAFRQEHGITDLPAELELAIASAADLRARALLAHADAEAEGARVGALRDAERASTATTVLAETSSDPGAARLGETRTSLATARARLSEEHPQLRALEDEAHALATRQGTELVTSRTVGRNPEWGALREGAATATAERDAARHRETSLDALSESERGRVDRLAAVEGRISELLAEVVMTETRAGELRTQRNALTAQLDALASDVRVVAPALVPEWPVRSSRRLVAMIAPLVGILLALVTLLIRATWRLRVHTASEASFWSNLPTVGSTTWPKQPRRLGDLARDLSTLLGAENANVLVVSLEDPALSRDVSRALGRCRGSSSPRSRAETSRSGTVRAFRGETSGHALRRAARAADRVIVLVPSGALSGLALLDLATRIGRSDGVGLVLVGVGPDLAKLPDRVGSIETFAPRATASSASSAIPDPNEV